MQALGPEGLARDAALDWLYGRDDDLEKRGIRGGTGRAGGAGPSALTTVDWLNDITRLFPRETVERLQRDAIERYEITDIVTDPAVLERVEPNPALLKAVLQTKHLMNPEVLRLARRIVEAVVRDLMAKMATEVRAAFTGTRARRPSRWKQARDFDMTRTIRANLGHYRPAERRLFIETPHFFSRTRKQVDQWQVILLVDQSGSMVDSVIHSAVTAACLWGLPGVRTHLVAFDTSVVDLTSDVDDPVELLMKVQLGGGTDIAGAVRYGAGLIEQPRRAIVALITDFYEGGSPSLLIRTVRELVEQGTKVLGLAALDQDANPSYDRDIAQRLADVGASVGAMTPGQLAAFVAEQVGR
jgi:Mg-chelatase subunit ChlD